MYIDWNIIFNYPQQLLTLEAISYKIMLEYFVSHIMLQYCDSENINTANYSRKIALIIRNCISLVIYEAIYNTDYNKPLTTHSIKRVNENSAKVNILGDKPLKDSDSSVWWEMLKRMVSRLRHHSYTMDWGMSCQLSWAGSRPFHHLKTSQKTSQFHFGMCSSHPTKRNAIRVATLICRMMCKVPEKSIIMKISVLKKTE